VLKKYLTNKEKYYFVRRIAIVSFVFFIVVLFLIPFLLPSRTYALGVEPVWQTLSSADGIGGQVQKVWRSLITAVNSLAVIILIVIAFSEILRINVNTYGIKKILPTLVLAIIAANFSYIFCRLMVDLANISLQFIGSVGGSSGIALEAPRDFNWDTTKGWWELFFNNLLLQNILLFILAILLLCLAFLFLVRNWMLYILVMLSPLAIMAMVLPSTKKYFTQWWTNMIQWSFMPVASYFFLALSVTFGTQIGSTAPLMGTVFVGVCYYLAITTPFKLGGTVMQSFYKNTGAKWAVNKGAQQFRKKVIDKNLDHWKALGYNKVLEQASKKGLIGDTVRRGLKRNADIELTKKRTEGLLNQGYREATIGGKYVIGEDGEGKFVPTFGNKGQAAAWGKKLDEVDSLFGEKEWAEKYAKQKFYEQEMSETAGKSEAEQAEIQKKLDDLREKNDPKIEKINEEMEELQDQIDNGNLSAADKKASRLKLTGLSEEKDNLQREIDKLELSATIAKGGFSPSALRSVQYEMRMAATDLHLANIKNLSQGLAYRGDPRFTDNIQFRAVAQELARATVAAKPLEKTALKAKGDFERESFAVPAFIHEQILGNHKAVATLKAIEEKIKVFGLQEKYDNNTLTGAELDQYVELMSQREMALEKRDRTREGYDEQMKKIMSDKRYFNNGQFTGIAATTLANMVDIQANGTPVSIENAKTLSQSLNIPGGEVDRLFSDRIAKSLSEVVKNEISSESGKRTGLESAKLLAGELHDSAMKYLTGNEHQLTAEQLWKVVAALNNAESVTNRSDPDYTGTQRILTDLTAEAGSTAQGAHLKHELAANAGDAISYMVMNNSSGLQARDEAIAKAIQDGFKNGTIQGTQLDGIQNAKNTKELVEAFHSLQITNGKDVAEAMTKVSSEINENLRTSVISLVSRNAPIKADNLAKSTNQITLNHKTGDVEVHIDADDIGLTKEIAQAAASADLRGIGSMLARGWDMQRKKSHAYDPRNMEAGKSAHQQAGLDEKPQNKDTQRELGRGLGYDTSSIIDTVRNRIINRTTP